MHGPVAAACFPELPGAVQRVHDPHPVRRQPRRVVPALLRQDGVARTPGRNLRRKELMGTRVARLAQIVWVAAAGPEQQQLPARLLGEFGGKAIVVGWHQAGSSPQGPGLTS